MEYRVSANNKAGSNASTAHSDMKRNIPGELYNKSYQLMQLL